MYKTVERSQLTRGQTMIYGLASILDGVIMILTLGSFISTYRSRVSHHYARLHYHASEL